jgi:hypothetical protein
MIVVVNGDFGFLVSKFQIVALMYTLFIMRANKVVLQICICLFVLGITWVDIDLKLWNI